MDALDDAVALVEAARPVSGVKLVGIDGHAGAGKSTFARALAGRLHAPLIETDDFLSWGDYESWWPRFEEQVLRPLLRGEDPVWQRRDWEGDEFGNGLGRWMTAAWSPVVVIEGVTSTRLAGADRYAVRIWIRTPQDLRLRRGLERDGEDHRALWLESIEQETAFFRRDPVEQRAHLHVDGTR